MRIAFCLLPNDPISPNIGHRTGRRLTSDSCQAGMASGERETFLGHIGQPNSDDFRGGETNRVAEQGSGGSRGGSGLLGSSLAVLG